LAELPSPPGYPTPTGGSIFVNADLITTDAVVATAPMTQNSLDSSKSPGIRLQTRRLKNEWSIEDVAADLNLRIEVIAALEADDYSTLPERTYVRGYLRAYARLLGIQEEEVLDDLPESQRSRGGLGSVLPVMGGAVLRSAQNMPKTAVSKPVPRNWVRPTLWSVLVIVLILLAWWVSGLRPSAVNGYSSAPDNNQESGAATTVTLPARNAVETSNSGN
jgi:cytoskeletal protein RodZ